MCAPLLAGLGAVMSIAQGAASFSAASQQADAQNKMYMENASAAQSAARDSYANLNTRREQTREAANQDLLLQGIQGLEKRGTAAATSAEAGVTGLSVDALMGDLYAQQGRRFDATTQQYVWDSEQIDTQMRDVQAQTQSRINGVQRATPPSPLGYMLGGMAGAVNSLGKLAVPSKSDDLGQLAMSGAW